MLLVLLAEIGHWEVEWGRNGAPTWPLSDNIDSARSEILFLDYHRDGKPKV